MRQGFEEVGDWYDTLVGQSGHYYHEHVILPKVGEWLKKWEVKSLLDLACGQGVLEKNIPKGMKYIGVDIAPTLIKLAQKGAAVPSHQFFVADITRPLRLPEKEFDAATLILAVQDLKDAKGAFQNGAKFLKEGGRLLIVMNHPCFRIPRQSGWGVEQEKKLQFRKLNCYLSHLDVPIQTRPSHQQKSPQVTHHHRPLSYYSQALFETQFVIEKIEEWTSDKVSEGGRARMENRARKEFPLFLTIVARKLGSGK
jgi:SAM-dependent methyltransferase